MELQCEVRSFRMLTPTVFELTFEPTPPCPFKAGQFVSVIVPGAGPGGRDLRRAYSIASAPEKSPIELCVKLVEGGPGTNYLYKLRPGMSFKGMAPYGDFVYRVRPGKHACFISTGTGIAPFKAMLESTEYRSAPAVSAMLLLGVRTEDELLYPEFRNWKGLKYIEAVSQPKGQWNGFKGRVTDYLRQLGSDYPWSETDFYLCGNGAMITEVKALLAEKGVVKESIHQEKYY